MLALLQNLPGYYTLDDVSEETDLEKAEGVLLAGVERLELSAEMYFAEATMQRISRNAQLAVPAGTTLKMSARGHPKVKEEGDEVVTFPEEARITSDQPLTFVYRNVPLAVSRELRSVPGDPEHRIRIRGRYRLLGALPHLHRYRRERGPKRVLEAPAWAEVRLAAVLKGNHEFQFGEGIGFRTSAEGGRLEVLDAEYAAGEWAGGSLGAVLSLEGEAEAKRVRLTGIRDAAVRVGGELGHRVNRGAELSLRGQITLPTAELDFREGTAVAHLRGVDLLSEGVLIVGEDRRVEREGVSTTLAGVVEMLEVNQGRDRISAPLIDLRAPEVSARLEDEAPVLHVRMGAPLDLRGLHWMRTRSGERIEVADARIRLNPFEVRLEENAGGRMEGLSGRLEAWKVSYRRGEDRRVTLEEHARLTFGAREVRLYDEEILVKEGFASGGGGRLVAEREGMRAVLHDAEVRVRAERPDPRTFSYTGEVIPKGGADLRMETPQGFPAVTLFVTSEPIGFSGDGEHIRIGLPELTLTLKRERVEEMLSEALEQNRERVRRETEEELPATVSLRRLTSLKLEEDGAVIRVEGRVYVMGGVVSTRFEGEMTVDFELPGEGWLHEADFGVRVTLTSLKLNRVNPRLEDLILGRVRQPFFRESRSLRRMVGEVPEGIRVGHMRIYESEGDMALEISGEAEFR